MRRVVSTVPLGTVINNNYAVTELMSIGGMGEVFRGENTFTGDAVAIKIVLQELAHDDNITALFRREAKVLCGLSHEAVVRYFNFVRDADLDRYCLIMEFVDGVVLSNYVQGVRPLTVDEAIRLMRRLAEGLAQVHTMDVIHRDLSPDNVILRNDAIDEAVLIDFGIAKSLQMSDRTLHGQLAGKFKFISPEQLGHYDGEIGPQTDIYGLALLIAFALRGEPLPMGDTIVEAVNLRRAIPDLRSFDPKVRALLAHMLEPDPADRPASMAVVLALLNDPSKMPEKYRVLGPKIETGPVTDAEIDAVFQAPSFIPGQLADPDGEPVRRPKKKAASGLGALRWVGVLALVVGAGYFGAQQAGFFASPVPEQVNLDVIEDPLPDEAFTRAGFLSDYADGCSFAMRILAGPQAGTIAAFGTDPAAFDGLLDAYDVAYDARPTMFTYDISQDQCPVLTLAKAMQARGGVAPALTLDSATMPQDGSIVGRLSNRRGRPVWLALVTPGGAVFNLTDRLVEQADGSATFNFGLTDSAGDAPQPQMLIALASDAPLIAAAAAADGAFAASLLPLIEAEIAARDGKAGIGVAQFLLLP